MKNKLFPLLLIFVLLGCSKEDITEERRMEIITSESYQPGKTYERRFECSDKEIYDYNEYETIIFYNLRSECGRQYFVLFSRDEHEKKDMPPEELENEINEYNDNHSHDRVKKHLIADFSFTLSDADSYGVIDFERTSEWRIVKGEYIPYESPDDGRILNYLRIIE